MGVAPGRYTYVGRLIVEFDANGVVTAIDPASGPMRVVGGDYPDAMDTPCGSAGAGSGAGGGLHRGAGTYSGRYHGSALGRSAARRALAGDQSGQSHSRRAALASQRIGRPLQRPSSRRTWRCKTAGAFATTP